MLATSTDGVGTKVAIAPAMGVYDTIGFDLIGMLVDDLVVTGAEPLFVTDYIACGKVHPERIAAIVGGIAAACTAAGAALLGGETAEHPGLLGPDEFDVAGATTGVVEFDEILGADRVQPGDVVLALASSGLHSNGYSLVRHVIGSAGWRLERDVPELGTTLGEALLTPTRVYAKDLLAIIAATRGAFDQPHHRRRPGQQPGAGASGRHRGRHRPRVPGRPPPIFGLVQELGGISRPTSRRPSTGRRYGAGAAGASVARPRRIAAEAGIDSWVAGRERRARGDRPGSPCTGSTAAERRLCGVSGLGTLASRRNWNIEAARPLRRGLTSWGAAVRRRSRRKSLAI